MKKRLRFLLMMCTVVMMGLNLTTASAQSPQTIEVGPHFGATSYLGDLNVWRHLPQWDWKQFNQFHYDLGAVVRFNYDSRWSFRLDYTYLHARAADTIAAWRPESHLNFKTTAHDLSLLVEFNFFDYYTGKNDKGFSPYLFGGISGLLYWVQPYTGDETLDAMYFNNLHAETVPASGNSAPYEVDTFTPDVQKGSPNKTLSIPFGIGCKISISEHLAATAEWRMHYTFTDFFDGVSGDYRAFTGDNNDPGHALAYDSQDVAYYDFTDPTHNPIDNTPDTDASYIGFRRGFQRGNARNNDWFGMFNLSLTWKFVIPDNAACKLSDK